MTSHYVPFEPTNDTFEDRIGLPDQATSALGHLIIGFSWLEKSLDEHIQRLAKLSPSTDIPPLADLKFRKKIDILSSLFRLQIPLGRFNGGAEDPSDIWSDFEKMLLTCDEHYNHLLRSYLRPSEDGLAIYATARGSVTGFWSHDLTAQELVDISDYIRCVDHDFDEFLRNVILRPSQTIALLRKCVTPLCTASRAPF